LYSQLAAGRARPLERYRECQLDRALATPGPVAVQAPVDPFEPPMPAKISLDQATKFAESLARGAPNRAKIAWTVLSEEATYRGAHSRLGDFKVREN
jgi:hypothetical protein